MPVLIEAISIVIRAEVINKLYPGGWEGFRDDCPNKTLCADNELIRVGFMTPTDAQQFVNNLAEYGIEYVRDGKAIDLVVVDQQKGFLMSCDWGEYGHVDWQKDSNKKIAACRRVDSKSDQIVTPINWSYEESLSKEFKFVESGHVPEHMDFLRHEGNMDVYRDLKTGKEVFVGRPEVGSQYINDYHKAHSERSMKAILGQQPSSPEEFARKSAMLRRQSRQRFKEHGGKTTHQLLMEAIEEGDIGAVKQHLTTGADVNAKTDGGWTPLDWAVEHDKTETADLLRKHGGKTSEELKAEGK